METLIEDVYRLGNFLLNKKPFVQLKLKFPIQVFYSFHLIFICSFTFITEVSEAMMRPRQLVHFILRKTIF